MLMNVRAEIYQKGEFYFFPLWNKFSQHLEDHFVVSWLRSDLKLCLIVNPSFGSNQLERRVPSSRSSKDFESVGLFEPKM